MMTKPDVGDNECKLYSDLLQCLESSLKPEKARLFLAALQEICQTGHGDITLVFFDGMIQLVKVTQSYK